jgi:hypothetical protein
LGAPLFIFERERKRGLNAEGAEVRAQSSQFTVEREAEEHSQ